MATRTTVKPIPILVDDREKKPWSGLYFGRDFTIERARIVTGDYTIRGMENIVAIERKSSWNEIALDVSRKEYRLNLLKSLARMSEFPIRYLILEDSMEGLFRTQFWSVSMTQKTLYSWMINILLEYDVHFLMVGKRKSSSEVVRELFRRIYAFNKEGRIRYSCPGKERCPYELFN